jgi:NADH:ubiquinone oxidoreductase subunit H
VGDVVTSFEGVRVSALEDLAFSGAHARVAIGIRRADAKETVREARIDGFRFATPRDLGGAALVMVLVVGIVVFFFAPSRGLFAWLERRVASALRVSTVRDLLRAGWHPRASYVAVTVGALLFAAMPFGRYVVLADLDIAILFLVVVTSLATIGWVSGGLRAAAQIVSFEVPTALAIACVVLMTGGARLHEIVRVQGGLPWSWYAFKSPVFFAVFALHFTSALAQGGLTPPDLAEAEADPEPVARGPFARRASFFAEWANVIVTCGTGAALFLGGWQIPGATLGQQEGSLALELAGSAVFLLKAGLLLLLALALRRILPVVRIEQTMRFCWCWLVPLAAAGLVLTLGWLAWHPGAMVERILALTTCALVALAFMRFLHRVSYALRAAPEESISPFL